MTSRTVMLTLHGDVGADWTLSRAGTEGMLFPDATTVPCKPVLRQVYDPAADDLVEMELMPPDREVRRFPIAVNVGHPDDVIRTIRCVDWDALSRLVREGDRLRVKGYFRCRRCEEDGETRMVREFVVKELAVDRPTLRRQAP